jgi:peptidoglycan/LPS O-acetylase OafA/YrhL
MTSYIQRTSVSAEPEYRPPSDLEQRSVVRAGDGEHLPQLDALRAIAVAGVLYGHFLRGHVLSTMTGPWGVRLFFVLSGFLITRILLRARDLVPAGGVARQFRVFYARRALRIFPAFYAVIALSWLIGVPDVREGLGWHLLYLSNVRFVLIDDWPAVSAPWWSLSVEEQFYLVWPALMLLLPRRALRPTMLAVIALGPLSRWAMVASGAPTLAQWTLPVAMLDSLGIGALLAYDAMAGAPAGEGMRLPRWLRLAALPSACLVLLGVAMPTFASLDAARLSFTALAIVFAWMVGRAARGWTGAAGSVMSWRPLVFLGRISYGIYLYHTVALWLLAQRGGQMRLRYAVALYTIATIVAAMASWYLLERPINSLKRFVPYARPDHDDVSDGGSAAPTTVPTS